KLDAGSNRLMSLIIKGTLTESQAEKKLKELSEQEDTLKSERDNLAAQLAELPDMEQVKVYMERIKCADGSDDIVLYDNDGNSYLGGNDVQTWISLRKSIKDQQALIDSVFDVPLLPDGKRPGVYITRGDKPNEFSYEIRGRLLGRV